MYRFAVNMILIWFAMASFIIVVLASFIICDKHSSHKTDPGHKSNTVSPALWGKSGIMLVIICWILAWNRFTWFTDFQVYTFTPIWLGYILIINALTHSRKGYCLVTRQPLYLLSLFVLSGAFWWYYEYLNT